MILGGQAYGAHVRVPCHAPKSWADGEAKALREDTLREACKLIENDKPVLLVVYDRWLRAPLGRHLPWTDDRYEVTVEIKECREPNRYEVLRFPDRPIMSTPPGRPTVRQRVRGFFRERWREACEAADSCRSDRP